MSCKKYGIPHRDYTKNKKVLQNVVELLAKRLRHRHGTSTPEDVQTQPYFPTFFTFVKKQEFQFQLSMNGKKEWKKNLIGFQEI